MTLTRKREDLMKTAVLCEFGRKEKNVNCCWWLYSWALAEFSSSQCCVAVKVCTQRQPREKWYLLMNILYNVRFYMKWVYIYSVNMPYALFLWISLVKQKKKRKGSNKKSLRERKRWGETGAIWNSMCFPLKWRFDRGKWKWHDKWCGVLYVWSAFKILINVHMASVHICIISWCKRGGSTHKATYAVAESAREGRTFFTHKERKGHG